MSETVKMVPLTEALATLAEFAEEAVTLNAKEQAVIKAARATFAVLAEMGSHNRVKLPAVLYRALDSQCAAVEALDSKEG